MLPTVSAQKPVLARAASGVIVSVVVGVITEPSVEAAIVFGMNARFRMLRCNIDRDAVHITPGRCVEVPCLPRAGAAGLRKTQSRTQACSKYISNLNILTGKAGGFCGLIGNRHTVTWVPTSTTRPVGIWK